MADDSLSLLFRIRGDSSGARAETKALERQIATLKDRIKEVRTESGVPFKTERLAALQTQLRALTTQHKELKAAAAVSAKAHEDFSGALSTLSPRLGGLAASLGGAIGPLTAVAAGLVAIGGAAVAIFEATKSVAEFQGKMFDLSQQTGVAVETLSALEIGAATTGGSIDAISQSLFQFQRKLEDARDPTSKEAELLKELGVQTNNTEQALRQSFTALSQMTDKIKQTDAAATLFGARGGKQVLAILKEWNGDLDGAIEHLRKLGILIDTDTAKAADKFNDQLTMLHFQLRGVVALIGREAMPTILNAVEKVSKALVDNREVISAWAKEIGDAGRGALILGDLLLKLGGILTGLGNIPIPVIFSILQGGTWLGNLMTLLQGVNKLLGASPLLNMGVATGAASSVAGLLSPSDTDTTKKKKTTGGSAKDTSLQDAIKEAELAERELRQRIEADVAENKRALEEQARDIEEFTRRAIELAEQRHDAAIVRINAEQAALDEAYAKKLISQKEYNRKNRELDLENAEAAQKFADEKWELEQGQARQIAAAEFAAHERSAQMAEEASERMIRIIKDRVDREIISEAEGERQIAALIALGYERRKKLLEDELTRITTSAARKAEINDDLIRLDGERADAAVQASQRIVDALKKEQEEREKLRQQLEEAAAAGAAGAAEGAEERKPGAAEGGFLSGLETGQLTELEEGIQSFEDVATVAFSAVGAAVNGLAQGIGSLVENWVLMGSTGPNAMKKMVASVLAGVAAQSAVLAIFELAKGFAALFFNPAEAAAHFQAAALFGSLAFVTAVAGRAVAGDTFKRESGTGGGGSSRYDSTMPERRTPDAIDVNRRREASPQTMTINFGLKDGIVVDHFKRDYMLNGPTRLIIKTDGQG